MMKSIIIPLFLIGIVQSQFGGLVDARRSNTTHTHSFSTTTKKPGWIRSKVTRVQEWAGIRTRSSTIMPRTSSTKMSFIGRVRDRFGFTRGPSRAEDSTKKLLTTTIAFLVTTTTVSPLTTSGRSKLDRLRDAIGFGTTTEPTFSTTTPIPTRGFFGGLFDKVKGALGLGTSQTLETTPTEPKKPSIIIEYGKKYGMKAVQKLGPMILKKIKENFHGMPRSFFSTDEEFPTQLQNFEGRTTNEIQELKDRIAKLEKLVDGLQSNMLKSWNMTESGTRYKLFEERKNWDDAEKHCQTFGAHLAVIDNEAKNSYTKDLLLDSQTADFVWIGMKTKTTNQATTFTNFASDSPIDGCAVLDKQGVWSIRSCIQLRPFICQIVKSNVDV